VRCCFPVTHKRGNPKGRQLTFDTNKSHDLDNNRNFSPDDQWLCYDTRPFNGGIGDGQSIEKVNVCAGRKVFLCRVKGFVKHKGQDVEAASSFPHKDSVIFVHEPNAANGLIYRKTRRMGAIGPAMGSEHRHLGRFPRCDLSIYP